MMEILQAVLAIKEKVLLLKESDKDFRVSGASSHKYQFNPALSEKDVETFENERRVKLPEDYKLFLTKIGNGGAGRGRNGVYPLEKGSASTNPQLPFKWHGENMIIPLLTFSEVENDEFDEGRGIVRICDGELIPYEYFLVVNGQEYGKIWEYYPDHSVLRSTRKSFIEFYNDWLELKLRQIVNEPLVEKIRKGMSESEIRHIFADKLEGDWGASEFEYPKNTWIKRISHKNVGANFDLVDDILVRINKTI